MIRSGIVALLVIVLSGCSTTDVDVNAVASTTTTTTTAAAVPADDTTTTSSTTIAPTTTTVSTTMPTTTTIPEPSFTSAVRATTVDELGVSWRDGCPVAVDDLRWVELSHWNLEGRAQTGVLVLHADHVDDVITVFARLFDDGFPIQSMQPITDFEGDDNASMQANNSSAFNCRVIDGTNRWSQHAYGGAIDINPLVNPWVRGGQVDPPEGAAYTDRSLDVPGLIRAGDVVTEAFADIGWGWGGDWSSTLDYQHFSHNGR